LRLSYVSDGLYKDRISTSGFVLRGSHRKLSAIGNNVVPGNPTEQSSYRSELAGISGTLAVVAATCRKYDITDGSILVALDDEQALLKASSSWPLSPTDTDIRAKIHNLLIRLQWQWIQGHQDNDIPYHALSGLAQDNVQADNIAKQRLNWCGKAGFQPVSQRFGDKGWSISLRGTKLSHLNYQQLYSSIWAGTALEYWAEKHNLPFQTVLSIDWDASGAASDSLSFARKRRAVKQACGHFGVGSVLRK
jgi:hypothetical protein